MTAPRAVIALSLRPQLWKVVSSKNVGRHYIHIVKLIVQLVQPWAGLKQWCKTLHCTSGTYIAHAIPNTQPASHDTRQHVLPRMLNLKRV